MFQSTQEQWKWKKCPAVCCLMHSLLSTLDLVYSFQFVVSDLRSKHLCYHLFA